jgi:pimeloyl-ACP methyl ester carboxylesterase
MTPASYPPELRRSGVKVRSDITPTGVTDGTALPLVCRWPENGAPKGFVVFCHGLGASGRDYVELSCHWAAHGYLVINPTFPDWIGAVAAAEPELGLDPATDLTEWAANPDVRARMYEILHTPFYWMERIRIVRQVMDGLDAVFAATCGPQPQSIPGAITGHSFGAYTSQLFAGALIDVPGEGTRDFKDNRFAAAILLSAQGRDQQGLREGSWSGITGPMLNVTGTLDGGAKGQDWHWKVEPYEFAPPGDKYLAPLTGAGHYLGGIARPGQAPVPEQKEAVLQLTLAFLDAYLVSDATAKAWLSSISDRIGDCPMLFKRK